MTLACAHRYAGEAQSPSAATEREADLQCCSAKRAANVYQPPQPWNGMECPHRTALVIIITEIIPALL